MTKITQEELLHWGNHAVTESWEHMAIQKLMEERKELLAAKEAKPAPKPAVQPKPKSKDSFES